MSCIHPNLLREGFLRDALVFELSQQRLQGHALQVCLHVGEMADVLALFGYDDLELAGILDERDSQGFTMMTVAVFANVATAGRCKPLGIELDRDRVGAMIP